MGNKNTNINKTTKNWINLTEDVKHLDGMIDKLEAKKQVLESKLNGQREETKKEDKSLRRHTNLEILG